MKRFILIVLFLLSFFIVSTKTALAEDLIYKARVESIINQGEEIIDSVSYPFQIVKIKILDGDEKGNEITLEHGKGFNLDKNQLVEKGETVVIAKTVGPENNPIYQIIDKYRLNKVLPVLLLFFLIVIVLSRWKGVGSILGMLVSILIIIRYIVPQILNGQDPLFVSVVGCLIIMTVTIYLAHGFSKKTTIALVSTFITLVITALISVLFVNITKLTGLGNEDAISLRFGSAADINFKGLLLGGILIGALGVLDDVTTSLTASIFELSKANDKLNFKQLFSSGISIGQEHISSLVNTLVLAYAGASLPIFLLIVLNPNNYPLWSILNDQLIIEEVVRTIAGSIGLVAAVPLTTFLATLYVIKSKKI